ncbi:hypothetical protein K2X33_01330 [bacterium]|nr:hypothetical protein [bacterium]
MKLVLVLFSFGILNNANAESFHSLSIFPSILGADPAADKATPVGRPVAEESATTKLTKKTTSGAAFKKVSEEQLKEAGIKDPKKFGESWEDPSGMIWGDMAKSEDGSPLYMDHKDAEDFCKNLGAELPSGYIEDVNGGNGFPDSDSDFVRLRKYMGAKSVNGKAAPEGYVPQILPNLTYMGTATSNTIRLTSNLGISVKFPKMYDRYFWSSSIYDHPDFAYVSEGGEGINGYPRVNGPKVCLVRCVVRAANLGSK